MQTAKQMSVGAQPVRCDVGVSPIVLSARNAEAVTQAVELLGIDCVNRHAAVHQRIDDRPMRNLNCDGDTGGASCNREDPIAQQRETRAVM
jgi:hypothetical protein